MTKPIRKKISAFLLHALLGLATLSAVCILGMYDSRAYLAGVLISFATGGFGLSKSDRGFVANVRGGWGYLLPIFLFWTNPLWLEDTEVSFLIWGPAPAIGWVFGVWLKSEAKYRVRQTLAYVALFLGFTAFSALWAQPRWSVFIINAIAPQGPVSIQPLRLSLPETEQEVAVSHFAGKIQVFNFWSYSCGACIEEFPWWEEAKQQFAGDTTIQFNLVRWVSDPARDSAAFASDWQPDRNSTLTKYIISDSVARSMGISAVPLVWVVDPAGKTLFWGGLPYWESGFKRKLIEVLAEGGR